MAKKITWWKSAEILGISDRQMRRMRERYEEHGYDGLMDRRRAELHVAAPRTPFLAPPLRNAVARLLI
jgi:hypothetical protein